MRRFCFIILIICLFGCQSKEVYLIPYFENKEAYQKDSIMNKAPFQYNTVFFSNIPQELSDLKESKHPTKRDEERAYANRKIKEAYHQDVDYYRIKRNDTIFIHKSYRRYLKDSDSIVNFKDILTEHNIEASEISIIHDFILTPYSNQTKCYIVIFNGFKYEFILHNGIVFIKSHPLDQDYFWKYFGFYMNGDTIESTLQRQTRQARDKEFKELISRQ